MMRKFFTFSLCGILLVLICLVLRYLPDVSPSFRGYFQSTGALFRFSSVNMIQTADLIAGGDVMLSRNIGYLNKKYGYDRIFLGSYSPLFAFPSCVGSSCLLFFNLESLFSQKDNDIPLGGFIFKANTGNIQTLLQLRGEHELLLSLANNHTINVGREGVETTQQLLSDYHIHSIGLGVTPEEAREIYQYTVSGMRLCFQAYSYDGLTDVKVGGGKITWNSLDEDKLLDDIHRMQELQCDVKIFSLHWGAEYRIRPSAYQVALAHTLIDAGVDLILGNHSHIPGFFETYRGKYIFYSFGNFLFDQEWGKRGAQVGMDSIYDTDLRRNTVPTYISMLAHLHFSKILGKVLISLDRLHFDRTTQGIHEPLSEETASELMRKITVLSGVTF